MSLFFERRAPETRAIDMGDWIKGIESSRTSSGVKVTTDKALQVGAMWSSTTLLASIVSNFPVDVFRGSGVNKVQAPLPPLIAQPSLIVTRREWVYQAMMSMLLRGNAYGLVMERDSALRPSTVEWLNPDAVTVKQASAVSRPRYELAGNDVTDDMVHLRAFVRAGSAVGMSPVQYHAESLGVSLAARDYGSKWFGEGGHPSAVFAKKTGKITPEQAVSLKARFVESVRGKREPLLVDSDWSYTPIQVSANESQFLESMSYTDAQVAKLYGPGLAEILGYQMQGSSLTYSNRVDRSLDVLTYAVMPWVTKFEDFWTDTIAPPQTARMNVNALLRADNKSRHETYKIDREIGLYNVDELRALEDLPPLPNGAGEDYTPLKSSGTGGQQNGGN